jgi:hypothetical protein
MGPSCWSDEAEADLGWLETVETAKVASTRPILPRVPQLSKPFLHRSLAGHLLLSRGQSGLPSRMRHPPNSQGLRALRCPTVTHN